MSGLDKSATKIKKNIKYQVELFKKVKVPAHLTNCTLYNNLLAVCDFLTFDEYVNKQLSTPWGKDALIDQIHFVVIGTQKLKNLIKQQDVEQEI